MSAVLDTPEIKAAVARLVTKSERANKPVDTPTNARDILPPEIRAYYLERRRALITELKALDKLLSITTE